MWNLNIQVWHLGSWRTLNRNLKTLKWLERETWHTTSLSTNPGQMWRRDETRNGSPGWRMATWRWNPRQVGDGVRCYVDTAISIPVGRPPLYNTRTLSIDLTLLTRQRFVDNRPKAHRNCHTVPTRQESKWKQPRVTVNETICADPEERGSFAYVNKYAEEMRNIICKRSIES